MASATSLLAVINDILDFSKIEAGKLEMESIGFDLRDTLCSTLQPLAVTAHEKSLELAYDVRPDVPEHLIGDPGRLRQVILNLVNNAIKFTDAGEIVVRVTKEAEIGTDLVVRFAVQDTGIGIPRDKKEAIFQSFSQADSSTTRRYGGTGLGLAICTRLVEMMGGSIRVDSEPGAGSTFAFDVFLGMGEQSAQRPSLADVQALGDLRVLVVEDNATNRRILEEMLGSWGMAPTSVGSGLAALRKLHELHEAGTPFRLVITDACMPEMDGFQMVELLRGNPRYEALPVIMLTSMGLSGSAMQRQQLRIDACLSKPVRQSDLLHAIQLAVGQTVTSGEHQPGTHHQSLDRPAPLTAPRGLRVLLVEDQPINQKVASRILAMAGHEVIVAENGLIALETLAHESFDLVLMDVQMPEMDGFEATAAIRQREAGAARRMPIIAMTARAMKGDRERCLAAGMDGYISKPISSEALLELIGRLGPHEAPGHQAGAGGDTSPSPRTLPELEGIDVTAALERLGGSEELLLEVLEEFGREHAGLARRLRALLETGDIDEARALVHRSVGMLGHLSADAAYDAAHGLELAIKEGDRQRQSECLRTLETEIDRLSASVRTLPSSWPAASTPGG
jgi:CheY-like chemotaxis protein